MDFNPYHNDESLCRRRRRVKDNLNDESFTCIFSFLFYPAHLSAAAIKGAMQPPNCNEDEARVLSEAVLELLECQLLEEEKNGADDDTAGESGIVMLRFRVEYEEKNHDTGDEEGGSSISPVRRTATANCYPYLEEGC